MEELRRELFNLIGTCELPPEAIFYIVKDFYRDLEVSYEGYIKTNDEKRAEAAAAAEKEEEKENDN